MVNGHLMEHGKDIIPIACGEQAVSCFAWDAKQTLWSREISSGPARAFASDVCRTTANSNFQVASRPKRPTSEHRKGAKKKKIVHSFAKVGNKSTMVNKLFLAVAMMHSQQYFCTQFKTTINQLNPNIWICSETSYTCVTMHYSTLYI